MRPPAAVANAINLPAPNPIIQAARATPELLPDLAACPRMHRIMFPCFAVVPKRRRAVYRYGWWSVARITAGLHGRERRVFSSGNVPLASRLLERLRELAHTG